MSRLHLWQDTLGRSITNWIEKTSCWNKARRFRLTYFLWCSVQYKFCFEGRAIRRRIRLHSVINRWIVTQTSLHGSRIGSFRGLRHRDSHRHWIDWCRSIRVIILGLESEEVYTGGWIQNYLDLPGLRHLCSVMIMIVLSLNITNYSSRIQKGENQKRSSVKTCTGEFVCVSERPWTRNSAIVEIYSIFNARGMRTKN